ncbi:hypothetical protein ACIBKY_34615 [Nonomuraea sp. NPDC050394]|uniref:hypothetical protein n=1 Tax=Nonomuraea sp. NPDC050394 TaxID=3364363 RepID=UPI0037BD08F6
MYGGHFPFINKGNGFEIVQANAVWRCLDGNHTQAYGHSCNGGTWQRWDVTFKKKTFHHDVGKDVLWYQLRNRQTGGCLDSNGRSVYIHACNPAVH